jgi:hypothetical protein
MREGFNRTYPERLEKTIDSHLRLNKTSPLDLFYALLQAGSSPNSQSKKKKRVKRPPLKKGPSALQMGVCAHSPGKF